MDERSSNEDDYEGICVSESATPPALSSKHAKPWTRKRKLKTETAGPADLSEVDKALLSKLNDKKENDDDVMLFLKSLASKLRSFDPYTQMEIQMEIMQSINRRLRPPPPSFSSHQYQYGSKPAADSLLPSQDQPVMRQL